MTAQSATEKTPAKTDWLAVIRLDVITGVRADPAVALRVAANYLIPFVVSNLGAMASHSAER